MEIDQMEEGYLSTSLKVLGCGVVGVFSIYGVYQFFKNTGQENPRNNATDNEDYNLPCNIPDGNETQVEVHASHNHLINFLNGEIQGSESEEFISIQTTAVPFIGRARALACTNIRDIIKELEIRGKVVPGQYDFLVEDILKQGGFSHYSVMEKIQEVQEKIRRLVNQESNMVESPTGSSGVPASETEEIRDAVVFYAETDHARQAASKFINDVKNLTSPAASISHWEEVGYGNRTELDAREAATKTHRYVFILMTQDLHEDPMTVFAGNMLLAHFLKTKQDRVVPMWFNPDRTGHPLYLSTLGGQNYYLLSNRADDIKQIFVAGFQKLIYSGRRTITSL